MAAEWPGHDALLSPARRGREVTLSNVVLLAGCDAVPIKAAFPLSRLDATSWINCRLSLEARI